jgi:hypothetical protein
MAKIEDVMVSDRLWRWKSRPSCLDPAYLHRAFSIIEMSADRSRARYIYEGAALASARGSMSVATIAAHAEPDPPRECEPGCTPREPCRNAACPDHAEVRAQVGLTWPGYQPSQSRLRDCDEAKRWRAESRFPELRCGRDLACGLFRVP